MKETIGLTELEEIEILNWIRNSESFINFKFTKKHNILTNRIEYVINTEIEAEQPITLKEFVMMFYPQYKLDEYHYNVIDRLENNTTKSLKIFGPRQIGLSTLLCLYIIWKLLKNKNTHIGVVCRNNSAVKNFTSKLYDNMYKLHGNFPLYSTTSSKICFENGSCISFYTEHIIPFGMTGERLDELILDNAFLTSEKWMTILPHAEHRIINAETVESTEVVGMVGMKI
jgi:hypothetical protein